MPQGGVDLGPMRTPEGSSPDGRGWMQAQQGLEGHSSVLTLFLQEEAEAAGSEVGMW